MTSSKFLAVIDTTESVLRRTVGHGILNVHVILAQDAFHARQILLRKFNKQVADQIRDSIYVYELDAMDAPLQAEVEKGNQFPAFSFIPLQGGRPPKQSMLPPAAQAAATNLGNTTLSQSVVPPNQEVSPQRQPAPQNFQKPTAQNFQQGSPRTQEFSKRESESRTAERPLTQEQRNILAGVGALSTSKGANEGVNLRVDAATGMNSRQEQRSQIPVTNLTPDKQALLRGLVNPNAGPQIVDDPELNSEVRELRGSSPSLMDESLSRADGPVLTDADIARLNQDLNGHQ